MLKKGLLFFALVVALTLLASCSGMQRGRMGRLNATVRFETGLERTGSKAIPTLGEASLILPGGDWTPLKFLLTGSGPNGASFSSEAQNGVFTQECASGEWVLEAVVISLENKELARGGCTSILLPGKTIDAEIVLYPIEGTGSLTVDLDKNIEMPAGARLVGSLRFKGLPGRPSPAEPLSFPIDLPASENQLSFAELGAGYYLLSLELKNSDGFVSGGCAAIALVLAGYSSSGTCDIEMGKPVADIALELYPTEPLDQALLSVKHSVPKGISALPLAVSRVIPGLGESITRTWFRNGSEAGNAVQILNGPALLPPNCFLYPSAGAGQEASTSQIDFIEEALSSHRFGISSLHLDSCNPVGGPSWKALAVYDYRAATGPSLCLGGAENIGSGTLFEASCAAASESGLVVVSNFDAETYLHAFLATYGAGLDSTGSPGIEAVPASASWLRLWRSRIKAGDYKSAKRLAVSQDGRYIAAAANSSAQWIWLCSLDEAGKILSTSYLTGTDCEGLKDFKYVKALCFSPSGDRLYAACSSVNNDRVYAFNTGGGTLEFLHSADLNPAAVEGFTLSDMIVTAPGLLAVSAPESSKIFILQDGSNLETLYYLENSQANTGLIAPTALAVSEQGDSFYALCDGDSVARFSRAEPASPYAQDSLAILSPDSAGASLLAAGNTGLALSETVMVGGGGSLECIEIAGDGTVIDSQIMHPEAGDPLGMTQPSSILFCRGVFLVAGGDKGKITVFGNAM